MFSLVRWIFLLSILSFVNCQRCLRDSKNSSVCQIPIMFPGIHISKTVCCEGYQEVGSVCIPVCKGGCKNGRCLLPNRCACNEGYQMVKGRCEPQCENECVNGICNEQHQCVCHDGYYFNERLLDFGIKKNTVCTPKCDQACSNGVCKERNKCKCNSGYKLANASDPFTCLPECAPEKVNCSHGKCIAPDKCECNEGYILVKNKCLPQCSPTCINGSCMAPGKCVCSQGFRKTTETNICEPSCHPPCENGICVGVNQCSCLNGYQKFNSSYCEPVCDSHYIQLENGHCDAPNVLRCNEGYKMVENSCIPECRPACINGNCTVPGECICSPGYKKTTDSNICEPSCDPHCENGSCVGVNQCSCLNGFQKLNNSYCEASCDSQYIQLENGHCDAPNVLRCNEGYTMVDNSCIPECIPACVNGNCTAPGECICSPGYRETNESNICEPSCDPPCENAVCVGVNQCTCLNGYRISNHSFRCEPTCDHVMVDNGVCTASNVVRCNEGFVFADVFNSKQTCVTMQAIVNSYTSDVTVLNSAKLPFYTVIIIIIVGAILIIAVLVKVFKRSSRNKFFPSKDRHYCRSKMYKPTKHIHADPKAMDFPNPLNQVSWESNEEEKSDAFPLNSMYDTPRLQNRNHTPQIVHVLNSIAEYPLYECVQDLMHQ